MKIVILFALFAMANCLSSELEKTITPLIKTIEATDKVLNGTELNQVYASLLKSVIELSDQNDKCSGAFTETKELIENVAVIKTTLIKGILPIIEKLLSPKGNTEAPCGAVIDLKHLLPVTIVPNSQGYRDNAQNYGNRENGQNQGNRENSQNQGGNQYVQRPDGFRGNYATAEASNPASSGDFNYWLSNGYGK